MKRPAISVTGAVLAGLYLVPAAAVALLSIDCAREGCTLLMLVTMPWFMLFLNTSSMLGPVLVGIPLNALCWYLVGMAVARIIRRLRQRS